LAVGARIVPVRAASTPVHAELEPPGQYVWPIAA
jgi:hypothetical protein